MAIRARLHNRATIVGDGYELSLEGEHGGTSLDVGRMTTATSACYGIARQSPKNTPRKAVSYSFYGSAAIACLVIACGWTVYSNIFAAGIYPNVDGGSIDVAAASRSTIWPDFRPRDT